MMQKSVCTKKADRTFAYITNILGKYHSLIEKGDMECQKKSEQLF